MIGRQKESGRKGIGNEEKKYEKKKKKGVKDEEKRSQR